MPELDLPAFFAKRRLGGVRGGHARRDRARRAAGRARRNADRPRRSAGGAPRARAGGRAGAQPSCVRTSCWRSSTPSAGEPALAAEQYRRIIALQPNNPIALNNLAYDMAVREKKPAEALPMARKALALAPREPTILDTVGWIEFLLGNTAEAAEAAGAGRQGRAGQPGDPAAHRVRAWPRRGPAAAAETELAEALKLAPALEKRADVQELKARLKAAESSPPQAPFCRSAGH